jgi:pSer/pThr/pTyr-binding forkhead associated (FHA) protein
MVRLVFTGGPLAGHPVEVTGTLVLGRLTADLAIDDPQVSKRHAALRPTGDSLEIEDLGSRNGTWVNGTRIQSTVRLSPGDRVQLGNTSFKIEGARVEPTAASPRPSTPAAGTFSPPPQRGTASRPAVATRLLTPTLLSFGIVIATAIALILYFAMR